MRIAWFTPFSPLSAIGLTGKAVCEELAADNEVDIWTHDMCELIETPLRVIRFHGGDSPRPLAEYDRVIYNMGNFAGNHREIYEMSLKRKGVVIIHDRTMSGFWGQYCTFPEYGGDGVNGIVRYADILRRYCGEKAAAMAEEGWEKGSRPIYEYGSLPEYDLLTPVLSNAEGVFTHSRRFCEELGRRQLLPAGCAYLPCAIPPRESSSHELIKFIRSAKKQGRRVIVSTGIVHPVKQLHVLAELLEKRADLRDKLCFIVIGSYGGEYGERLEALSRNIPESMRLAGYQPENVMWAAVYEADMCVNLRWPNTEVCSLSLLEQMSAGRPVLVINSGIYAEMPDDSVIKLPRERLEAEVCAVMERLIRSPGDFGKYGENAARFVAEECTVRRYCESLTDFLGGLDAVSADYRLYRRAALNVISRIGGDALPDPGDLVPPSVLRDIRSLEI